jgi:hypothetical protein
MRIVAWTGAIVFTPTEEAVKTVDLAMLTCGLWKAIHKHEHEVAGGMERHGLGEVDPEAESDSPRKSFEDHTEEAIDEDWDVWNERNAPYRNRTPDTLTYVKDSRAALPDFHSIAEFRSKPFPPCFAIEVEQLPRGAPMEWWSYGISQGKVRYDTYKRDHFVVDKVTSIESGLTVSYIRLKTMDDLEFWDYREEFKVHSDTSHKQPKTVAKPLATIYTTEALPPSFLEVMKPQVVPCRSILAFRQHGHHDLAALVVVVVNIHPNPRDVDNLIPAQEILSQTGFRIDNSLKTMDCRPVFLWPKRQHNETDDGSAQDTIDPSSR